MCHIINIARIMTRLINGIGSIDSDCRVCVCICVAGYMIYCMVIAIFFLSDRSAYEMNHNNDNVY